MSKPDDALKCLICLAVARDPWQHGECGKLFCEKCLNKHGKDKPCPNCRMKQPMYMVDTKSKSVVLNHMNSKRSTPIIWRKGPAKHSKLEFWLLYMHMAY